MAKKSSHPDVSFVVLGDRGRERYFKTFDEAAAFVVRAALEDGLWRNLSILVRSESGARWLGGDASVEKYRSDPDASVFDQLGVKVESRGMIS